MRKIIDIHSELKGISIYLKVAKDKNSENDFYAEDFDVLVDGVIPAIDKIIDDLEEYI